MPLPSFPYVYRAGPVASPDELAQVTQGNCRLAVQAYFQVEHGMWLPPEAVLTPGLWRSTGYFVYRDGGFNARTLMPGDVVLAERLRRKDGTVIRKTRADFPTEDEWVYALHTAIVLRQEGSGPIIWHATAIDGRTCEWVWERFTHYYQPVAVKRVLGAVY